MALRERVIELLEGADLNQKDFSEKADYSRQVLNHFLTGKTQTPKIDLIEAIKRVFPGVSLEWLFTGKGPKWVDKEYAQQAAAESPVTAGGQAEDERKDLLLVELLLRELERVADRIDAIDPKEAEEIRKLLKIMRAKK